MLDVISRWFKIYFSDPEGIILAVLLLLGFGIVIYMGDMLAPLLASIVIAYFLEGMVAALTGHSVPRSVSVLAIYLPFLAFLLFLVFGMLPLMLGQLTQLAQELPNMIGKGQQALMKLPEYYPHFISEAQLSEVMTAMRASVATLAQQLLSLSLASISGVFTILIYLILIPVLVFFFLKDKSQIIKWVASGLPQERQVAVRVWEEMDQQIGNYVRGKFAEIFVVGIVSYVAFAYFGLNYATLLAVLVGLSVVVPYIGAVAVTFPVVLIAFFQWGWGPDFIYLVSAYLVIQALDGNVLVPLLFSEAVNLHPVAIIAAVLVFGGIWGFWGVFFAIPLATLVKAVLSAWPRTRDDSALSESPPAS
ncbi:MAG: AI-2E family transporter [Gammaproteobacteria bacterium]|nr:AI-2E family transporter [Gammaproteobacteria bacterium]